jgi:two-component system response regulator (stage 0 sporulation protein A)
MDSEARRINIIIIEDNKELNNTVRDYLSSLKGFEVTAVAYNGIDGLKAIKENPVDVVLLDIVLPGMDGINILEEFSGIRGQKRPSFIMFTAVSAESLTKRAIELGADYFVLKPFGLELLAKRVEQIYEDRSNKLSEIKPPDTFDILMNEPPAVFASNVLRKIGIQPNLKGYTYLKYAIAAGIGDKGLFESMTKEFYPAIANQYNTTASCVERAIRHSIEKAWGKGANKEIFMLLGYDEYDDRPSNSSFIRSVVEMYSNLNSTDKTPNVFK